MKFFTYIKQARAAKHAWQKIRFAAGHGYYLIGKRPKPKPKPAPAPAVEITMYDSVDVKQIPANAAAVAGYVGGRWPTYAALVKDFPRAHKLSIAVSASEDADCLDIEKGDATIPQAPAWVRRQHKRGIKRPVVYTSVSQAPPLLAALTTHGIKRDEVRLWTAHYTLKPHRCSSACGYGTLQADATQYANRALDKNLDASLCSSDFFA